jgi:SulP family sulfate permease
MAWLSTKNLKGDMLGGITAGIVALPLALAFGEASGAGPMAGLWGAIFVGFFASLLGGTGAQVSGPTGPMVVVFAGVYGSLHGDVAAIFSVVVVAGLLQILGGFARIGQYIRLVPYPVVSGFMSGIGVIIIALQMARLFGHEPLEKGTIPALTAVPNAMMHPNMTALGLSLVTLGIVFFWPKRLGAVLPSPLAALIVGTLLALMFPGAPIIGNIPTGFPEFIWPSFSKDTAWIVMEAAVLLALLGAIDSLLTSLVADNMTRTRHHSNRELIGQGVGNTVAGLFGGVPGAGATMRTVVNIRSGGETRLSGTVHALLLLAVVLALSPLAERVPHAVLAGILVKVGYDIIDWSYLKRAHKGPRWDWMLMLWVLGLTVLVDLITAVATGVVLAALAFVKQMADIQLAALKPTMNQAADPQEKTLLQAAKGKITLFDFGGPLSFGAAADLGHQVREHVEAHTAVVILDFSRVPFLDLSAAKAVETIAEDAINTGKDLYISGVGEKIGGVLEGLGIVALLPKNQWFRTRKDALEAAGKHLGLSSQEDHPMD